MDEARDGVCQVVAGGTVTRADVVKVAPAKVREVAEVKAKDGKTNLLR